MSSPLWLFIAFFGLGAGNSGYQMSAQNIVFEFGTATTWRCGSPSPTRPRA
ncbi:MAG: hypothetical protein WDM81_04280 [Rhizomicrobium sp.]